MMVQSLGFSVSTNRLPDALFSANPGIGLDPSERFDNHILAGQVHLPLSTSMNQFPSDRARLV